MSFGFIVAMKRICIKLYLQVAAVTALGSPPLLLAQETPVPVSNADVLTIESFGGSVDLSAVGGPIDLLTVPPQIEPRAAIDEENLSGATGVIAVSLPSASEQVVDEKFFDRPETPAKGGFIYTNR